MRIYKKQLSVTAQDFGGYYSGKVPDSVTGYLGTSSVDASQIQSAFNRVNDAIRLVNQFDSSLLNNVAFIFNFSKGGAYGVYLSELDRAIKTKELKKELEGMGYKVELDDKGLLKAYSEKEEVSQDKIQKDIDSLYRNLESRGGTAFGVNMSQVVNAARMDAMEANSKDPDLWQWIGMLHLGGTIVHEATHALGAKDEGPAEEAEKRFTDWALPIVNSEYEQFMKSSGREEQFAPLTMTSKTRHANQVGWYKVAQSYYNPSILINRPTGSDLSGRHPVGMQTDVGIAGWSMMAQESQNVPIEQRLGKQYMSALPQDLSQQHNSIEEQLRKYTREDKKNDPDSSTEDLLASEHDDSIGYQSLEELLNSSRPKPILVPIKKEASINSTNCLFGYMNNLTISDGSTIPGLSDRVMEYDDAEEDFRWSTKENRTQPRYNPEYDDRGFAYIWVEPRFSPQLFDDMVEDGTNTHPAKRFASTREEMEYSQIISIVSEIVRKIIKKDISCTRLIISEDLMRIIDSIIPKNIQMDIFSTYEDAFAVWLYLKNGEITIEDLNKIEYALVSKKLDDEYDSLIEKLFAFKDKKKKVIDSVLSGVKDICNEYSLGNIYVIGQYPREMVINNSCDSVDCIDFIGDVPERCMKVGSMLAKKLGVRDIVTSIVNNKMSYVFGGLKLTFYGSHSPSDIKIKLESMGIAPTPLNLEMYNRNFTLDMLVYDIANDVLKDVCGQASEDLEFETVNTFFDANFVCEKNPLAIWMAIRYAVKYKMKIDKDLKKVMRAYLNDKMEEISNRYAGKIEYLKEQITREDIDNATRFFEDFGIN